MAPRLKDKLETTLGSRVVETRHLGVGFRLTGLEVRLADGRHLAVKAREAGSGDRAPLDLEAYMLNELVRLSELPVPHVHYADADLLVMDFIDSDGGGITPNVERHAAELIAKLHAAVHGGDDAMTRTGMIIGTPAYMAPEQALGVAEVSDRADVYAVGVLLFRLLSERHPFEAESLREMMMGRVLREAPSLREFQPSVPESLARLIERCLARQPGDRPRAGEVARQLAAWADATSAPRLEQFVCLRPELLGTVPFADRTDAAAAS